MIKAKTISNLIKVFPFEEPSGGIFEAKILKNETFSYQISLFSDEDVTLFFGVESKLKNNIIVRKINYIKANKLGLLDNEEDYMLQDKNNPCFSLIY